MNDSADKTAPKATSVWVKLILLLLSGIVGVTVYSAVNIDNSVKNTSTKIDQAVESIGVLETNIGDRIHQEIINYSESAADQIEPITIEGWLVLETEGKYYRVVLDESPVSPMTTTTQAPVATSTTVPEPLPRPRIRDYRDLLEADGCQGVPGSDQWCFYSGGAASYVAWRLNSINFRGPGVFANTYGLDELSDGPTVWGHPRDWAQTARALGIQVDEDPARGAVAQWEGDTDGDYGFVAYVEDITSDADEADSGEDSGVAIVLSYMNLDGDAVPTDPTSWNLSDGTRCSPDSCGSRGWPDNFIHIRVPR